MKSDFMFTSESVTEGHPDKLCDQISDAIVDAFLETDPFSRVIAECAVSTGILFLATRFCSQARLDIPEIARRIVRQAGYEKQRFNASDATIMTSFQELPESMYQSRDEADMDDAELDRLTAHNPATVFGYACNQTPALMPLPISLAHRLARRLTAARLQHQLDYLAPDGQSQIGIEYRQHRPHRVHSITLVASQMSADHPDEAQLRADMIEHVIEPVFRNETLRPDPDTRIWINPLSPVVEGGPALHAGTHRAQECGRYLWRVCTPRRLGAERQGPVPH